MNSTNQSVSRMASALPWPMLVMIAVAMVALITSVWAVRSYNEVQSLETEIAALRANANASVFELEPTENAPNAVRGQVFISLSGSGVVITSNLPHSGDNEEFRLWYLQDDESASSGGSLTVDANGQGFALIPGDTGNYSQIAISLETVDTDTPTTRYLLIADVRSGRG